MAINFNSLNNIEGLDANDINEIRTLAETAQALFTNKDTRREAQRLMKKINPNSLIPELEQDDAVAAIRTQFQAELDKRDQDLANERAARQRAERLRALKDNGLLQPEDVVIEADSKLSKIEQYMIDNGITNYDAAARLFALERQHATPSPSMTAGSPQNLLSTSPQLPVIDLKKDGANNINDWARQEGMRALNDLRSGKVKLAQ